MKVVVLITGNEVLQDRAATLLETAVCPCAISFRSLVYYYFIGCIMPPARYRYQHPKSKILNPDSLYPYTIYTFIPLPPVARQPYEV